MNSAVFQVCFCVFHNLNSTEAASAEAKEESDSKSIHVGNVSHKLICVIHFLTTKVDFSTKPEELQAHFATCGTVQRITIICDKVTGKPKGYT